MPFKVAKIALIIFWLAALANFVYPLGNFYHPLMWSSVIILLVHLIEVWLFARHWSKEEQWQVLLFGVIYLKSRRP